MTLITKPDFTYVWASGGAVVAPNDSKKQLGWVAEAPPFQYDNWLQNRQDQMLAHINQRGMAAWDGLTDYEAGGLSYTQGSDGKIYKSVAASGPATTVQDPTTDVTDTYWTVAFASNTQATETVQGIVELATQAEAETGIDNERAMTALRVKQAIDQFAGDFVNNPIATVAAATTINLTTGAPNTSQLAISGTGATINGFTVAANRFFIVKMTGASNTLINSASLITGRGANIPVVAGDSFLMRSTAANTVEIVGGDFLVDRGIGSGQTWQDVTGSRAIGVTYTNTTGRPIQILVLAGQLNTNKSITLSGVSLGLWNSTGSDSIANSSVSAVIPEGGTYLIGGSAAGLISWSELR